ncbi:MAG TPA: hypothetical protein DDZ89_00395 [Clostridiales bacterium]|nr:hypothetical protein [Clostridiales bacterium]
MSLLSDMILEESQRNLLMQRDYQNKIEQLPKGTIVRKKVGNHEYYYLKYRNGKKTVTDYIGCDRNKVDDIRTQVEKRKHFEKMLAELEEENKLIDKLIGVGL